MVVVEMGVVSVTTTDLSSPSAAAASALCCSTVGTLSKDGGRFFFFGGTDGTSLSSRRMAGGVSVAAVADEVTTLRTGTSALLAHHSLDLDSVRTSTALEEISDTHSSGPYKLNTAFLNEPFPINTPIRGNDPPEQALIRRFIAREERLVHY